jgi:O-acetylhomoserine/O-acetylserine sulfhydrylase-like pyridoxal-dependent enzyme
VSNPLLEIADLRKLSEICKKHNLKLIVDNTFSPLSDFAITLGADVVIHSLTKFINGSSDTVGGVYCASQEFIDDTKNVNNGVVCFWSNNGQFSFGKYFEKLKNTAYQNEKTQRKCNVFGRKI